MLTASFLLILSFTTDIGNKEEYVIDHSLTKQDCYERMNEEIKDSEHMSNNQMYQEAVERYNAVKMEGNVVEAYFKCVKK